MKLMSINIRGLGTSVKRGEIRRLVAEEKPDCLFIQESKLEVVNDCLCHNLWGSRNCDWDFVPSSGRSGGIISIWEKKSFHRSNSFSGLGFLGMTGTWKNGHSCNFINIYSPCDFEGKVNLWNSVIDEIQSRGGDSWCILGDFNAVLDPSERKGNTLTTNREIQEFNRFIENAGVHDLPLLGRKYTWSNRDGSSMSRIDRVFISGGWLTTWPGTVQKGLSRSISDHCPIILYDKLVNWGPKPFRSLDCWFEHQNFASFVDEQWKSTHFEGSASFILKEKLKALKNSLKVWNNEIFGQLDSKIKDKRREVEMIDLSLEEDQVYEGLGEEKSRLCSELWLLLKRKNNLLFQKSRLKWLKDGDANSKYFHNAMNWQRKRNEIQGLLVNQILIEGVEEVKQEIFNHFSSQFAENEWNRPVLDGIDFKQLSHSDSSALTAPFTEEEIKLAVWGCGNGKSPGPDGFNFKFIKAFWNLMKREVCDFIHEFHRTGKFVKGFNPSFIVLIPKVDNPLTLRGYRPISLISSMYKILAKILATRLAAVLPTVISDTQSGFLSSRSISDGVLITNEVIDEAKKEGKSILLFKADFEKAFDTVNWGFLDHMMHKLGLNETWRSWIRQCLSSGTTSVLVNGSPTKEFKLGRGLRQGDPLSPLLFLIVAEGLNGMISSAKRSGALDGYEIGRDNVTVTHLQFADDTIIISKPTTRNVWAIKSILRLFELASGLKINFSKSRVMAVNGREGFVQSAALFLGCKIGVIPFKYLGVPVGANPRRVETWLPLVNMFKAKLSSWQNKFLSLGGRIVLLKSVISSLPIYYFSFYLAPVSILNKLKSLQLNFLWGGSLENRKTAWIKWDKICLPKSKGGLGIKNLEFFNIALLGKWRYKLLADSTSLWKKVLVSRYGSIGSGAECSPWAGNFSRGSYWWKDIGTLSRRLHSSQTTWFSTSMVRVLGNGASTTFWHHAWAGQTPLCIMFPRLYAISQDKDKMIADMGHWDGETWVWKWNWRRDFFQWEKDLHQSLRSLILPFQPQNGVTDSWCWKLEPQGSYSVRSAYALIAEHGHRDSDDFFNSFWCSKIPLKMTAFAWKACYNRIPTKLNLSSRNILPSNSSATCPFCSTEDETTDHLLFRCSFSQKVWMKLLKWWGFTSVTPGTIREHFDHHLGLPHSPSLSTPWRLLWFTTIWYLWKHRNSIIFNNSRPDPEEVFDLVRIKSWFRLKFNSKGTCFRFSDWCIDPTTCIMSCINLR